MNNIQILDCTLRDGGYCNNWKFGLNNAKKITSGLVEANIEIIECGFISNRISYDEHATRFPNFESVSNIIPTNRENKLFIAMINYGEFEAEEIPDCDGSSVDGLRVAFHKKNVNDALELARAIKEKGYFIFLQPMLSLNYSDVEFMELIFKANELCPYAFYIVDSFGVMKSKDLTRFFYLVEHNLNSDIWIGFHSHNNMQLAYSNAMKLTHIDTNRNLIIDSSIYGMGRGAGNLNTELFVQYLNENAEKKYQLKPLLGLIDEILNEFYQRNSWGYSLPNYISAAHNAHPYYAGYLDDKKSLTIDAMDDIFCMMDDEKKISYDKEYVENLYIQYMESGKLIAEHETDLKNIIEGNEILLIAPGKSSVEEKEKIRSFISDNKDVVVISINHNYSFVNTDFVFVSNLRRFRELDTDVRKKAIVTSNIPAIGVYSKFSYHDLMNTEKDVSDNAGLMAIMFVIKEKARAVYLAGYDGYKHDVNENYGFKDLEFTSKISSLDAMNRGMNIVLKEYSRIMPIKYITSQREIEIPQR